mmetsp:Transcript_26582/g.76087  ORF Transcript_26582/g.76087 Transcript_26582/m.76087 type:complete len:240 (-) Transcript_26582:132-851(-)
MQPEHLRDLGREPLLDVLDVMGVLQLGCVRRLEARGQVGAEQQLWGHEHREVRVVDPSVPRIRDVAAVHDLAEDVPQVRPRHVGAEVLGVVEVVLQHRATDREVAIVEGVLLRPALGAELDAAGDQGVEEAEGEQGGLKLLALHAGVDVLLRELGVGALEVRLQVRGRLIGDLDAALEDGLRDEVPEATLHGPRRLGGEEGAEVLVRELLHDLEAALELLEPVLHQVDVLEHDPAALLG